MLDWAKEIKGWKGMKPVELMVQMVESGYEMETEPATAVKALGRKLAVIGQ